MPTTSIPKSVTIRNKEARTGVIPGILQFYAEHERQFSYATALLKHGRYFEYVEQHPAGLQKGAAGECFANCARAVMPFLVDTYPPFYYAEGYALDSEFGIPFEHAWLVNASGKAIDLTWKETDNAVYYGVTFKHSFVIDAMRDTRTFGILGNLQLQSRLFESEAKFKAALSKPRLPGLPIGKH